MPRDRAPTKGAKAAKFPGEQHRCIDPGVPEWRNPPRVMSGNPWLNQIGHVEGTW